MPSFIHTLRQSPIFVIWVLVIVVTTGAMETDIFVPSFPAIKDYFNTTESWVQLIVGINFLGLCISSLAYGPLSDVYGRRHVLLAGNILFLIASVGCIKAETIESLLLWRFMQGLGTSVVFIVPGAIIYDIYNREEAAKTLGWFGALITFVMACAPMIGAYVSETWHWQANFILVASLSVISFILTLLFVGETLPVEKRQTLDYKKIVINYFKVLTSREAFWYITIICCLFAGELVYITNLSLIFIDNLQMDEHVYSYYQGSILLTFALFSYISGRLIYRCGMLFIRNLGFSLCAFGGFTLLGVALLFPTDPLLITLSMCIYILGFALCCGILYSDFMQVFPDLKGLAAALGAFLRLLFISVMIAIAGFFYDGTILPVAIMVALFCVLLLIGWVCLPPPTAEIKSGENLMH